MARPVVATALAVEGLSLEPGEHVVVAEGGNAFAAAIARLLADDERRTRLGDAGRQLVERAYTWDACAARYDQLYHELADRRERQAR
jgi:glycosyltransferase involved in cell wall biosynthesis